ncbi:MAG: hypothetical protein H7Z75_11735 [Ferruginibacter sp.]|nr:hypothetical protein [Cytophagales bacterium]
MRTLFFFGILAGLSLAGSGQPIDLHRTRGCGQLVVVQTPDWQATQGQLDFYEWDTGKGRWVARMRDVAIVVGKNGLAWGNGLHERSFNDSTDDKREGDGKAPAGIFGLGVAFGYAPWAGGRLRMPYVVSDSTLLCVDDPNSAYYNRLVDQDTVARPDWQSFERMRLPGNDYRYGLVVGYNVDPPVKGRGSCIFLHLWSSPTQPTIGCTAMAEPRMRELLARLDPAQRPLLVQMPRVEYQRLRKRYRLP